MRSPVEVVAPRRLGTSFRWLFSASVFTNIGDGIALAAGPLLIASQTSDPRLVAMALFVQRLPFLLLGLFAGVLTDRLDRRLIVVTGNTIRVLLLIGLVAVIATGSVSVVAVLAALFLLGVAETFVDTTQGALLPMMVAKPDLGIANARMMGSFLTANQLVGPPIGAALFAIGMVWPFAVEAVLMAAGAVLVSRIRIPGPEARTARTSVLADVRAGVRWLVAHPAMRTLALTVLAFNITFGAAWAMLVLLADQRLGLNEVGYGLLLTAMAVGGIAATFTFGWLERFVSFATLMRVGLIVETLTHLILATTTWAWLAGLTLVAFGAHAFIWGTIANTIRQRAVPTSYQGRVTSVTHLCSIGGLLIGAALGGVIAGWFSITAPFWFAFVGSAVVLALIWRQLDHIAHADS
ncbi:MFS transporter [Nocardioides limicola]|uniref:MFS transporter n=1 Tax=Nocardioides limicola TaxID=2803368 RepID=UPI00193B8515|nr:MFS transporter [Nocardioides sp. DJM-14]